MEWNKLVIPIVGITVSIFCLATILMPVIQDGTTKINETTFYNETIYEEYAQYYTGNYEFKAIMPEGATTPIDAIFTVNGDNVELRKPTFNRHIILDSDNLVVEVNTSSSTSKFVISVIHINGELTVVESLQSLIINYTPATGTLTLTSDDTDVYTIPASYMWSISNKHDYTYLNTAAQFANQYMSKQLMDSNKGGVISVYYTDIVLDEGTARVIIVSDIKGTRLNPIDVPDNIDVSNWTAELIFNDMRLVDGTTDIYTGGTPSFKVTYYNSDDTEGTIIVTPTRSFVAVEIPGHLSETSQSNVLWAIPVMVILVILMAAASIIMRNRE